MLPTVSQVPEACEVADGRSLLGSRDTGVWWENAHVLILEGSFLPVFQMSASLGEVLLNSSRPVWVHVHVLHSYEKNMPQPDSV